MRYLLPTLALLASPLMVAAEDRLSKPVISPPITPDGGLDALNDPLFGPGNHDVQNYRDEPGSLQRAAYSYSTWSKDWMPEWIVKEATKNKFSLHDFTCYDVKTADCDTPWNFCIHKDSPLSIDYLIWNFARLPVRMREYVGHIMAQPGNRSAYTYGDNIVIQGDCHGTELVHEVGHNLNAHAYPEANGGLFTDTQTWLAAYDADKAVPDGYAQSSQGENHSQFVVIALFDVTVPGGIPSVEPNSIDFFQQYITVVNHLGDKLQHGGTCNRRFPNSKPVNISQKRSRLPSPMPDVSIRGDVEVLESRGVKEPWRTVWDKSAA